MHQNFVGNARRRPHVNLSGRTNQNPFNSPGSSQPSTQTAVANAQQNRIQRQRERERREAVLSLQKTWRGYAARKGLKDMQRKRWDEQEHADGFEVTGLANRDGRCPARMPAYTNITQATEQCRLLLRFLDLNQEQDVQRLSWFYLRLQFYLHEKTLSQIAVKWPEVFLRLESSCLAALARGPSLSTTNFLYDVIKCLLRESPHDPRRDTDAYYRNLNIFFAKEPVPFDLILMPLRDASPSTGSKAYESFARYVLTSSALEKALGGRVSLIYVAKHIQPNILSRGVVDLLHNTSGWEFMSAQDAVTPKLWLLAHFIFLHWHSQSEKGLSNFVGDLNFVFVVENLLASVVGTFKLDTGFSDRQFNTGEVEDSREIADEFVRDQCSALVTQTGITDLLGQLQVDDSHAPVGTEALPEAPRIVASYILALLQAFPSKATDIQMWLYLGAPTKLANRTVREDRSVLHSFWQAMSKTEVYNTILLDSNAAIRLLRMRSSSLSKAVQSGRKDPSQDIDDQWRLVLIFTELYTFALGVMDDDTFFASEVNGIHSGHPSQKQRINIPLEDIRDLVTFMKYVDFALYYRSTDIIDWSQEDEEIDLATLFKPYVNSPQKQSRPGKIIRETPHIAGLRGMPIESVKRLVTGLLRAVYARDSRRQFLPKDHWLMTSKFDMTQFIDAVVQEEERRHQVQTADEDDERLSDADEMEVDDAPRLVGTGQAQRLRNIERLQRQQRKASRRRYMQAVAPRLEILQNMPFIIPFLTRVQIFRRFIRMDQFKRRHGYIDGDEWRLSQFHRNGWGDDRLNRHHAEIRREKEFDDAFEQFFGLGADLKEPIQITFVDRFGQPEAGIDGGGVTKEFLTSVTNQVFAHNEGIQLFAENDQHLLYPNPSALEEQKELLREAELRDGSPDFKSQLIDLLHRYEFLGRIIGKCLYEGILIDVGFAPFFLIQWSLFGGAGTATRESGYRASINDLRDLDDGLYNGLIQLKNYVGNVEDFSLNFTVTDTISVPSARGRPPKTKNITRELRPNGANIPVTNANRLLYISEMARHRLQKQSEQQNHYFLRGLASIIQPSWLSMFNQSELQTLVGGAAASISIDDLRRHTTYSGVYSIGDDGQEHPSIKLFWEVLRDLSESDRGKVLKFVTSTPRAPLLGFGTLNPPFSIRDSGGDETRLPSTSTCVNLLKLPIYKSKKILKEKLLQAVNSGAGFDLS